MIHEDLQSAINHQINQEFTAAYNYLGMATYFDAQNLDGFANWMLKQHDEEQAHGMKLLNYLQDRGGKVKLESLPSPRIDFSGPLEIFKSSLVQEQKNTCSINDLYELATKLNDHATKSHLQWFIDEQVEEEKSVEDVIALLERIGDDPAGLLYLDDKLAARQAEEVPV
ncbi:ferritin [Oceaniferula spumae]|uniref:Ferritin n=1 Tax=Oceaniferula spumae TaxID=2979115 RepID=A0AAT9FQ90_9BACT